MSDPRPKRRKCEHGCASIKVEGCVRCISAAITGGNLLRALKCDADELVDVLRTVFPDDASWRKALEAVRQDRARRSTGGAA